MRIPIRKYLSTIIVLSMFLVTASIVPDVIRLVPQSVNEKDGTPNDTDPLQDDIFTPILDENQHLDEKSVLSEDTPSSGILNPAMIEQSGYAVSDQIDARTDTYSNLNYDLPIDTVHNWVGSEASVSISDLTRLYAVNGTFDDGLPGENIWNSTYSSPGLYYPYGWDSNSTTLDTTTTQRTAYNKFDSHYVLVENQGKTIGTGGNERYQHSVDTEIMWDQTIDNRPYNEHFVFSTNYLYKWGPIDPALGASITLIARVDGTEIWSVSLASLSKRDLWYNTGDVSVYVPGAGSTLSFEIGLKINVTLSLNPDDYGVLDAYYITSYFDDVLFTGVSPPEFESVDLQFHAGVFSTSITGSSGVGSSSIVNPSYWDLSPVQVSISSNTSVSFSYTTKLFSHRFTVSNWKTDVSAQGSSYSISYGQSASIVFYTYVGYFGYYQNSTLDIMYPVDWTNSTVYDSFLTDVTSQCTVTDGKIEIPTSLVDRLGWWQIQLQSPNYAKSMSSQIYDDSLTTWNDAIIFRIGNTTRANITIGTSVETPSSLSDVYVTWFLPSGLEWTSETLSGIDGSVIGTGHYLASGISPAGLWSIEVLWTNGTELAYEAINFEVHHVALLTATPALIETYTGETVTGIVRYSDLDTGTYITDDLTTISGNWSLSTVYFVADTINNWWEVSLDTSLVGAGVFHVLVNADRQYYDPVSCEIVIESTNRTRLNSPNSPWSSARWGNIISLTFNYERYYHPTSSWEPVTNSSDVKAILNWTDGFWNVHESAIPGIYHMDLDTTANPSGTYLLNATFSKLYHESKQILLTLIVSPTASSLTIFTGSSSRVDIEEAKSIKIGYFDEGGDPVQNAIVVIDSISPSSGLSHSPIEEVIGEDGNYSLTVTPFLPTVFTLRFIATGDNVEPASSVFILLVNDVVTNFHLYTEPSVEMDLLETYNTTFRYEMFNGTGIENAEISVVYSGPTGYLSWNVSQTQLGNYTIQFGARLPSTYVITIIAYMPFYQQTSSSFSLIVRNIPTNLLMSVGSSTEIGLTDTYDMTVLYEMYNGTGIEDATISVVYSGPSGYLSWNISQNLSGNYTIQFGAGLPSTYVITIIAYKQYHQQTSNSFSLIVSNIATELLLSVGSNAEMGLTDIFEMSILYEMYNGTGIEEAAISVIHSGAEFALSPLVIPVGQGNYSIQFTAALAGSYLVTITTSKQYHQSNTGSFLLVVRGISTTLTSLNGTGALVGFGHDYRLCVNYVNGTGYGLVGANVSIVDADDGITWELAQMVQPGIYSILLTPLVSNSLTVTVQASLANHQTKVVFFTLTVTAISTTLVVLNSSTSIAADQNYTVYMQYQDEDFNILENASLGILNPPFGVDYSLFEELGDGIYRITLTPFTIGTFEVVFSANKDGYQTDYAGFTLTATIIQTELRTAGGISRDSTIYSNQYELLVFYERTDMNQNISLATVDLKSTPTIGLSWSVEDISNGYLLTINSDRTGRWTLTITANRTNYAISSIQFILDITPIPISVEYLSERSVTEGSPFDISLRLTIQGTQTPISNASVFYRISTTGTGQFITLEESQTPGVYSGTFTIPLYLDTTEYTVEVRVDKDNYELLGDSISFTILKRNNDVLRWTPIISGSGISVALILGLAIGTRVYNTRKRRRNLEALQVKKRFDDVSNILGIIVLHKQTGLPIYSKMIKGGFEEAMISAFITAITHFRSEFQMDEKHWEFNVIPISDIISAVPTKSLLVAFITVRPPSKYQETSMAAFGRATGALFDEILADTRVGIVDESQTEVLDTLFYDLLDGYLIERFRTAKDAHFPKSMTCLANTAHQLENGEGFKLEDLAKGMATCGIEESHAYKIVMDAIDEDLIEMAKENNNNGFAPSPPPESLDISDIESDEEDDTSY